MDRAVAAHFARLERSRAAMLQRLASWSLDQVTHSPAPGAWSAAQVMDHIARTENDIYSATRLGIRKPQPITRNDRIGSFMVRWVMRLPMRVTVPPDATSVLPEKQPDFVAVLDRWSQARDRWRSLLERTSPVPRGGVFAHPRGGWFTLPETVLFLRLHHEHHLPQLARLRRASR